MNAAAIAQVQARHAARFGAAPSATAVAPGRVEVLGNHTDYNDGVVLSAAIDLGVCVAAGPSGSKRCTVQALDIGEEAGFDMPAVFDAGAPLWLRYMIGVAAKLAALGARPPGFNATVSGDVPAGSGLSSSAAFEVASALALCRLADFECAPLDLAKACQAAENEFTGARCGLLDQFSSIFGRANSLVFCDFRSLSAEPVLFPQPVCFLVVDTGVRHSLATGEYNMRRAS